MLPTKNSVSKRRPARPGLRIRTRDDAQVRRKKIIDEALRLIGRRGYHGFTIKELAERCDLSNAGLLHHFPSKDQLFTAVIEELEQRQIRALGPLVTLVERNEKGEVPLPAAIDLLQSLFAHANSYPEVEQLYAVLQAESLDTAHPAHESFRARESAVLDLFAKVMGPHVADPRSTARLMLALLEGLRLQWLRAGRNFDPLAQWIHAVSVLVPKLAPLAATRASEPPAKVTAVRGSRRAPGPKPVSTVSKAIHR